MRTGLRQPRNTRRKEFVSKITRSDTIKNSIKLHTKVISNTFRNAVRALPCTTRAAGMIGN